MCFCSLLDQVYVRQELWKYRRLFDIHEQEWRTRAFKKLDINFISDKVVSLHAPPKSYF